jgi:N-acylneuraminate cytidylyltransferase
MNIAIIPARGGSKRIPRKNIKPFCGKPIIAWSIETALNSKCFEKVIVSTDDEEIASIAKSYGAEVPFIRSHDLADDFTPTKYVVTDAIKWLSANSIAPKFVCCIYPTAPFLRHEYLISGLKCFEGGDCHFAMSIAKYPAPIQRAFTLEEMNKLSILNPEYAETRTQDLNVTFHDAGQFYWGKSESWLEHIPIFSNNTIGIEIPAHLVHDIDTIDDWIRAEYMFTAILNSKS